MAQAYVARQLVKLRAQPVWREGFVTDNGNHILDVHELNISNPLEMESRLSLIPGILTVGIFAHRSADILLIAGDDGVREMRV
jgi:ribose 5-phosphate isomerase A